MVLGAAVAGSNDNFGGISAVVLPMIIAAAGILFSIAGTFLVKVKEGGNPQMALNIGNFGSVIMTGIASFFIIKYMLPADLTETTLKAGKDVIQNFTSMHVFGATLIGLAVGTLISIVTEYYTAMGRKPVMSIVRQSSTGAATNIIAGLGQGMMSTALPILILAAGIIGSYEVAGLYGIAMAASGMMATTGWRRMQLMMSVSFSVASMAARLAPVK